MVVLVIDQQQENYQWILPRLPGVGGETVRRPHTRDCGRAPWRSFASVVETWVRNLGEGNGSPLLISFVRYIAEVEMLYGVRFRCRDNSGSIFWEMQLSKRRYPLCIAGGYARWWFAPPRPKVTFHPPRRIFFIARGPNSWLDTGSTEPKGPGASVPAVILASVVFVSCVMIILEISQQLEFFFGGGG